MLLGRERAARLRRDVLALGPARGRHGGHAEPLHQRGGAERHTLPQLGVDQVERQVGGEHGAAEIHEHDHAPPGVRAHDGVGHPDGIGAERPVLEARRHLQPDAVPVEHLRGETDRGLGERPAVRDDDDADGRVRHGTCGGSVSAAAATSSAADVAPGSWCPTLRSPR